MRAAAVPADAAAAASRRRLWLQRPQLLPRAAMCAARLIVPQQVALLQRLPLVMLTLVLLGPHVRRWRRMRRMQSAVAHTSYG